jgi:hypothetical protein
MQEVWWLLISIPQPFRGVFDPTTLSDVQVWESAGDNKNN